MSEIGKYVVDEESRYIEEGDSDDEAESKTVKVTDHIQKKYGINVFETSALLGSGIEELFDYVTKELLMQQVSSDKT